MGANVLMQASLLGAIGSEDSSLEGYLQDIMVVSTRPPTIEELLEYRKKSNWYLAANKRASKQYSPTSYKIFSPKI